MAFIAGGGGPRRIYLRGLSYSGEQRVGRGGRGARSGGRASGANFSRVEGAPLWASSVRPSLPKLGPFAPAAAAVVVGLPSLRRAAHGLASNPRLLPPTRDGLGAPAGFPFGAPAAEPCRDSSIRPPLLPTHQHQDEDGARTPSQARRCRLGGAEGRGQCLVGGAPARAWCYGGASLHTRLT